MSWVVNHRFKLILLFFGVVFLCMEIPLTLRWIEQMGGINQANDAYFRAIFHDPIFTITMIDFTATGILIFIWMLLDTAQHRQYWLPIVAFVLILLSPTVALVFYLLCRKRAESIS